MLLSKKRLLFAAGLVFVVVASLSVYAFADDLTLRNNAIACSERKGEAEKVDCWLQLVFADVRHGDLKGAYGVFDYLYRAYPEFATSGCHQHAHKVGDVAYYEYYIAEGRSLEDMNFPQETVSCGYGFYHGFIEHLIQDHPQSPFVKTTCEYLRERYSGTMRDIGTICYHASGHGFTQSQADKLARADWGKLDALVPGPLMRCEALPDVPPREIEDCREGVFNVISDWMVTGDFGLKFDYEKPFVYCNSLPEKWRRACYYEFGMKLGSVTGDEPVNAASYVRSIPNVELRNVAFNVMVAGMMGRQGPLNNEGWMLEECLKVPDDLQDTCVLSIVGGIMEHGTPGVEYEKALTVCGTLHKAGNARAKLCYQTLAWRLNRFYPPEKKTAICNKFPEEFSPTCASSE